MQGIATNQLAGHELTENYEVRRDRILGLLGPLGAQAFTSTKTLALSPGSLTWSFNRGRVPFSRVSATSSFSSDSSESKIRGRLAERRGTGWDRASVSDQPKTSTRGGSRELLGVPHGSYSKWAPAAAPASFLLSLQEVGGCAKGAEGAAPQSWPGEDS